MRSGLELVVKPYYRPRCRWVFLHCTFQRAAWPLLCFTSLHEGFDFSSLLRVAFVFVLCVMVMSRLPESLPEGAATVLWELQHSESLQNELGSFNCAVSWWCEFEIGVNENTEINKWQCSTMLLTWRRSV